MGSLRARPFHEVGAPVLTALDEKKRGRVRMPNHPAVDADVRDARLRIAGDDAGERVDVAPTLQVVPLGNGELCLVDCRSPQHDVLHRPCLHENGRDRLTVFLHYVLHQLAVGHVAREAKSQGQPGSAPNPPVKSFVQRPLRYPRTLSKSRAGPFFWRTRRAMAPSSRSQSTSAVTRRSSPSFSSTVIHWRISMKLKTGPPEGHESPPRRNRCRGRGPPSGCARA